MSAYEHYACTAEAIPLDVVVQLIEAAETRVDEIESPMVVMVANSKESLTAQHWIDGVWLTSVNISRNKIYTSVVFDVPAHELAEVPEPGSPLYGLDTRDDGRMAVPGGGYSLGRDGEAVGTVGISDGAVTQNRDVVKAGVERWTELVEADVVPSDG